MSDETDTNRRLVMGGLATGLLAALASPAMAQQQTNTAANTASGTPLVDPTTAYPRPPFPEQQQQWPGLARDMTPKPDHGERSYKGSGRLAGRKALITGGDSGIGRAAAIAYAREGADVAFNYLPAEEPDAIEVIELIKAEGRMATPIPGDLRSEEFCTRLVEGAVAAMGGLDILVNNAAYQHAAGSLTDITTEQFDQTFKTNIYAPFWLTKAALRHMQPGSAIINTASVVAYDPPPSIIDYSASKAAIMNFTKSLAKQLAPKGIRVNAVAPGPFWTPLQPSGGQLPHHLAKFGSNTPMGRPGQPVELAGVYVLLASNESSFATGQVYAAVGGEGGP